MESQQITLLNDFMSNATTSSDMKSRLRSQLVYPAPFLPILRDSKICGEDF